MSKAKRARIQDVAKKAGVSNMTVSRVLNKDVKVSAAKTALVLEAVKALNYRPNVSARRLASNKSFFLGLLYCDLDTSYVSKFVLRALKHCRATGHHLVVDEINGDHENDMATVADLINITQVDGVVLLPPVCDNTEVLEALEKAKVPFVRIAPDTQLTLSPYICVDEYQAGFDMTEMLINQGHHKIAHIIGNPNQGASRLRYQGYLDALRSNKINVPVEYIEQGMFTYDSGVVAAKKLLTLKDRPTAIFAANDEMAAAVINVAHYEHINVPEQVSVAGFDDVPLAITISPHLTTIRQPIQAMAELAIDILAAQKNTTNDAHSATHYRHVLDFEIIQRDSTMSIGCR
jgi:LacI family transcriptional regulator